MESPFGAPGPVHYHLDSITVEPQELKELITAALGKGPHPQGLDDCGPFTPHWAAHPRNQ